jgi:hypothetical protein
MYAREKETLKKHVKTVKNFKKQKSRVRSNGIMMFLLYKAMIF